MACLRRRPSSPLAGPLEDDDLLAEILLRLPPLPSSLPRASAVSRHWRSLASDPRFSRRFRARHRRNSPLLGCFVRKGRKNFFLPALQAPNRIPEGRFTFPIAADDCFMTLGCRHGLVLIFDTSRKQILVLDPVTGDQHRLDIPPGFHFPVEYVTNGAVLRDAGDAHHFQVVFVGHCEPQHRRVVASVYSSKTGAWGNLTPLSSDDPSGLVGSVYWDIPAVMVGNSLYWWSLLHGNFSGIIEFDLDRWRLAFITVPGEVTSGMGFRNFWIIPAEDGALGVLILSGFNAQFWKRKTNCDGIASWLIERTIALDKLLSIHPEERDLSIIGFAEENNMVLLWRSIGVFTVQLDSLQFQKLPESDFYAFRFSPFEGVYTADKGIDGGQGGAGLLQNM